MMQQWSPLGHARLSDWVAVPGACVMEAALGSSGPGALRLFGSPRMSVRVRVKKGMFQTGARVGLRKRSGNSWQNWPSIR